MSDLYSSPSDIQPLTRVRSVDINTLDQAIGNAFGKLPNEAEIKRGTINYAIDTSLANNTYLIALPYAPLAYVDGMEVTMRPIRDNTGAATLNVNGLGPKSIKRTDGTNPAAKDILANGVVTLRFNAGIDAFVLPPVVNSQVVAAAASAAAAAQSVLDAAAQVDLAEDQVTLANNARSGAQSAQAAAEQAKQDALDALATVAVTEDWGLLTEPVTETKDYGVL